MNLIILFIFAICEGSPWTTIKNRYTRIIGDISKIEDIVPQLSFHTSYLQMTCDRVSEIFYKIKLQV